MTTLEIVKDLVKQFKAQNPYHPATCETEVVAFVAYNRACDDICNYLEGK